MIRALRESSPRRPLSREIVTDGSPPKRQQAGGSRESIWVGVRIRPASELEVQNREQIAWQAADGCTLRSADQSSVQQPMAFCFDKVFRAETSSEQVYQAAARERVASAMAGLNATIFVYGQTGSGKTYTMRSIVQKAAREIFSIIEGQQAREYLLRASAVEIYNEKVRDLFRDGTERQNLLLQDDPERGTVVDGAIEEGISSVEQLSQLLHIIEERRMVCLPGPFQCSFARPAYFWMAACTKSGPQMWATCYIVTHACIEVGNQSQL